MTGFTSGYIDVSVSNVNVNVKLGVACWQENAEDRTE